MKKVLMLTLVAVLALGMASPANAADANNGDFKIRGYSAFVGGDYFGIETVADIGSHSNLILGLGRVTDDDDSTEIFVGKRLENLELGQEYGITYDLAVGLNTEDGIALIAGVNYPLTKNYEAGLMLGSSGGLAIKMNYMY
ncbi:MAG: hypothetical protein ACQERJ_08065 [Bacillota bacterium]